MTRALLIYTYLAISAAMAVLVVSCSRVPITVTDPAESIEKPTDLSSALDTIREKHVVPALAAGVWIEGEMQAGGASGIRQVARPEAVTLEDQFHIGSCTKAMTATMLARLVERDELRWELTLSEAFPELSETMDPKFRDVTLWELLIHRGGMPKDLRKGGLWTRLWQWKGSNTEAREEIARTVLTRAPESEPHSDFTYSNGGYAIAGLIAERATGKPWEQLMQEEVFDPLGMSSVGFGPPGTESEFIQPRGHVKSFLGGYAAVYTDNPPAIGPAATVHLSLTDWAKFGTVHARGGGEYLKAETLSKLHDPGDGTYAAGWIVPSDPDRNGPIYTHAGSNTMWYAVIHIVPKTGAVYLVASNAGDDSAATACDEAMTLLIEDAERLTNVD